MKLAGAAPSPAPKGSTHFRLAASQPAMRFATAPRSSRARGASETACRHSRWNEPKASRAVASARAAAAAAPSAAGDSSGECKSSSSVAAAAAAAASGGQYSACLIRETHCRQNRLRVHGERARGRPSAATAAAAAPETCDSFRNDADRPRSSPHQQNAPGSSALLRLLLLRGARGALAVHVVRQNRARLL